MKANTSILEIKGIGEKTGKLFQKLNIETVGELIHCFPRDYETFEEPTKISALKTGNTGTIYGAVTGGPNEKKIRKLSILNVNVSDGTGLLHLTFFNMPFLKKTLKQGGYYIFRGNVQNKGGHKCMEQPRIFGYEEYYKQMNHLLPKYSLTKGLSNQAFQKAIRNALSYYEFPEEYYSSKIINKHDLISCKEAIETIHFPSNLDSLRRARKRLVFDEFFNFLYQIQMNKKHTEGIPNQFKMFETADTVRFLEGLPYPLTNAQKKVWQEIRNDLSGEFCMNRLIQGDVGSGKTIIAILALLMVAANGYQGALMAPTEVLATQHFDTVNEYIKLYKIPFRPVLLVGSMSAKEKKEAYELIASGYANLVIGTHALIQDKVQYHSLALVVTDEQHRFGVNQREHLAQKGISPHILVMSATPIPRTLAIIMYGDLQISVIDELPSGRLPIKNCVVNTSYRTTAYKFITSQIAEGRQVYIICPQVEAGESDDLENVIDYTLKLKNQLPETIQITYLHGKMRPNDKNQVMDEFAKHTIDILVSTTVIEVGINVPNATVMMIENAERFGLAQLHQLRGRVGRGEHQSYCIFVSSKDNKETMERLNILNHSNDGFYIASQDLKLRGPGDLFGIRQSGEFSFQIGDIYTDASILQEAAEEVSELIKNDLYLELEENSMLKKYINSANANKVDFRSI